MPKETVPQPEEVDPTANVDPRLLLAVAAEAEASPQKIKLMGRIIVEKSVLEPDVISSLYDYALTRPHRTPKQKAELELHLAQMLVALDREQQNAAARAHHKRQPY
jgi:hypothetical protein